MPKMNIKGVLFASCVKFLSPKSKCWGNYEKKKGDKVGPKKSWPFSAARPEKTRCVEMQKKLTGFEKSEFRWSPKDKMFVGPGSPPPPEKFLNFKVAQNQILFPRMW